jgi:dTMP kinase
MLGPMLLAIEGVDGAGKGTLARNLLARAAAAGVSAASLSFPRYEETHFARLIAQYLNGRFGALGEAPPRFAALLYAGDRGESRDRLRELLARCRLVVLDRYVASNVAYNAAKLPEAERTGLIAWLHELEYDVLELPAADLTCLLTTPPAIADALVARKAERSYTAAKRDLHEADRGYLAEVARVYDRLATANARSTWLRLAATDEAGALRPPDAIADELWTQVQARL